MKYIATVEDQVFEIEINSDRELVINGHRLTVDFESTDDQPVYSLILNGRSYEAYVYPTETAMQVLLVGRLYPVEVEDERTRRLRQATRGPAAQKGEIQLRAPMPGLVVAVPVSEGQAVASGQDLIILESMKMQNELKAPREGVIARLRVRPGDRVEQNQVLLVLG